ncbi:MAG: hypothetical protein ACTH8X_09180 [Corynebacterium variabile]
MSENPLHDVDMEVSAITASFSNTLHRVTGQGRGGARGRGMRQTRQPSRRQIRSMSTGQLTKYMYTTHTRGMSGANVSGESNRISSELNRRGMNDTLSSWKKLEAERPGPPKQASAPAASTATVAAAEANQAQSAHNDQQAQNRQPSAATEPAGTQPWVQTSVETTQQTTQETTQQSRQQTVSSASSPSTSSASGASPMLAAAAGVLAAEGTMDAADKLADAVDGRAGELGLAEPSTSGLDSPGTTGADLDDIGASPEASMAAGFGAGAVTGDLGQALADQAEPSGGLDIEGLGQGSDNQQSNQNANTADVGAGAEIS